MSGIAVALSLTTAGGKNDRREAGKEAADEHEESGGLSWRQRHPRRRVARPRPKVGEAVVRITATTICGTDVHFVKGEYPVRPGLILGHEPVGVIEELGEGLEGVSAGLDKARSQVREPPAIER